MLCKYLKNRDYQFTTVCQVDKTLKDISSVANIAVKSGQLWDKATREEFMVNSIASVIVSTVSSTSSVSLSNLLAALSTSSISSSKVVSVSSTVSVTSSNILTVSSTSSVSLSNVPQSGCLRATSISLSYVLAVSSTPSVAVSYVQLSQVLHCMCLDVNIRYFMEMCVV